MSASLASSALARAVTVDEVGALEVVVQPRAAQDAGGVRGERLQRAEDAGLGGGVVDDHQQQRVGAVLAERSARRSASGPAARAHSSAGPGRPRRARKAAGSSTRMGRPRRQQAGVDGAVERRERQLVQAAADGLAGERVADRAGRGGDQARARGGCGRRAPANEPPATEAAPSTVAARAWARRGGGGDAGDGAGQQALAR